MKTAAVHSLFQAFADPTRLRVLHLLRDRELCVGDLVEVLEVPQPTASRHLRLLRDAELVDCRKRGRWCIYRLTTPGSELHRRLLGCLASCLGEVPELQIDAARLAALRAEGGCCRPER